MRRASFALALVLCTSCGAPAPGPFAAPGPVTAAPGPPPAFAPVPASAPPPSTAGLPAPAPVPAPAAVGPGSVLTKTFHSDALGVDKSYVVYLPGGYEKSAGLYPVIYLLHGYSGDETNWVKVGDLPQAADALSLRAIVIMPDGDDSFYSNWVTPLPFDECQKHRPAAFGRTEKPETFCVRQPKYEDYIVRDLVAHVDATYRTAADRRARAIIGLSMGGFGALMLAMRHQDAFSIAASHSGVVSPLYEGPHPYVSGQPVTFTSNGLDRKFSQDLREQAARVFGADLAAWRAHDPSALAASLKPGSLAIYLDCGTEDGFKLADQASYLHDVLTKAGVAHTFELAPGEHSFAFWKQRIGKSLAFAATEMKHAGY